MMFTNICGMSVSLQNKLASETRLSSDVKYIIWLGIVVAKPIGDLYQDEYLHPFY